jgi:hypothetical protein
MLPPDLPCCGIPSVMLRSCQFSKNMKRGIILTKRPMESPQQWLPQYQLQQAVVWRRCQLSFIFKSARISYGTKIAEAVAPASLTASATLAKTGRPRCVCPAFLGFVPPTTLVPVFFIRYIQLLAILVDTYRIQWLVLRGSWTVLVSKRGSL